MLLSLVVWLYTKLEILREVWSLVELRKHVITDNEQFHYLGLIIGKDERGWFKP